LAFSYRGWVDDPVVGCSGCDLVSEVFVAGAVVFGVDVSEVAISEFVFLTSVSFGVLSPKQ